MLQSAVSRLLWDTGAETTNDSFRKSEAAALWETEISQTSAAHHEMLEEPRAHNVGGMFRQNPPLIFGLFVFAVQQGRKVQVYLENKNQDRHGLDIVATETKRDYQFFFFFFAVARAETPSQESPW